MRSKIKFESGLVFTLIFQVLALVGGVIVIMLKESSTATIIWVIIGELMISIVLWLIYADMLTLTVAFLIYGVWWVLAHFFIIFTVIITLVLNQFRKEKKNPFWIIKDYLYERH